MATTAQDSADDASTTHRRIALQSRADLSYLKSTALRAARAKIDLHLPLEAALRDESSGLTEDDLRKQVEQAVADYVDRVFLAVRSGVEVNGLVYDEGLAGEHDEEAEEQYEAYDAALAERVMKLHARIEELDTQLARTRATAAGAAAQTFRDDYSKMVQAEDERLAADEQVLSWKTGDDDDNLIDVQTLGWAGRQADVQRTWETAAAGLASLSSDLDKTQARAQHAVEVGSFLTKGQAGRDK